MAKEVCEFNKGNGTGFSYVFDRTLKENEEVIVKMPAISANKRGINDIGWQTDGEVKVYGTLYPDIKSDLALWEEISEDEEINKTVTGIKIVNSFAPCRVIIRAILF